MAQVQLGSTRTLVNLTSNIASCNAPVNTNDIIFDGTTFDCATGGWSVANGDTMTTALLTILTELCSLAGAGDRWSTLGNAATVASTNFIGTTDAIAWRIRTNNTERVEVGSTGLVGVGMNGATEMLQVAGNIAPDSTGGARTLGVTGSRYATLFLASIIDYSGNLGFKTGGTTYATFTTSGKFGFGDGVTSPASKVHIVDSGNPLTVESYTTALEASISIRKTRGTFASPTSVGVADIVGGLLFKAHDGTAYGTVGHVKMGISEIGTSILSSYLEFSVSNAGSVNEAGRITKDGFWGFGNTAPLTLGHFATSGVPLTVERNSSDTSASLINVKKTRGTFGVPTVVGSADKIGGFQFYGYDGAAYDAIGSFTMGISAVSGGNLSSFLEFSTSNAGTVAEVGRITKEGYWGINNSAPDARLQINMTAGGVYPLRLVGSSSADVLHEYYHASDLMAQMGIASSTSTKTPTVTTGDLFIRTENKRILVSTDAGTSDILSIETDRIGVNTGAAAADAILDLTSLTKALLLTRVADPANDINSPVDGMVCYNTTMEKVNIYEDGAWRFAMSTSINNTVTAGQFSNVGAGGSNTASGQYSFIGGGTNNTSSGIFSFVAAGTDNVSSGNNAFVGAGANNSALGDYSSIPGGVHNIASNYSVAGGLYAYADRFGSDVYGADVDSVQGGTQTGVQLQSINTTNNTPTVLHVDGVLAAQNDFTIPTECTVLFRIEALAIQTGGASGTAGDTASWIIKGTIKNVGGTTAIVGAISYETPTALTATPTQRDGDAAASAWDVSVAANNSLDILEITATGETNKNIKWMAAIHFTEVRY